MSDEAGDHDLSPWCWCRPALQNHGAMMLVLHRDLDESHLSSRKLHLDKASESDGWAAKWRHLIP